MNKQDILLADNDPDDIDFFKIALDDLACPHILRTTNNGLHLTALLEFRTPDILFMDIDMPFLDGMASLKIIRSNKAYTKLPVVIYSSHYSEEIVRMAFEIGANLYIKKANCIQKIAFQIEQSLKKDWTHSLTFPSITEFVLV